MYAWDLPHPPVRASLDLDYYKELLLRAAEAVLEPFVYDRNKLEERLYGYAQTVAADLFSYGGAGVYALDAFGVSGEDSLFDPGWESGGEYSPAQNTKTATSI